MNRLRPSWGDPPSSLKFIEVLTSPNQDGEKPQKVRFFFLTKWMVGNLQVSLVIYGIYFGIYGIFGIYFGIYGIYLIFVGFTLGFVGFTWDLWDLLGDLWDLLWDLWDETNSKSTWKWMVGILSRFLLGTISAYFFEVQNGY